MALLGVWHQYDLLFAISLQYNIWPWSILASNKVVTLHMQIRFMKLQNKKTWSSLSLIIRITKGQDYEFLPVAVQDIW